jgi:hypothetical protein
MPRVTAITAALSAAFTLAPAQAETPPGDLEAMPLRLDHPSTATAC